MTKEELQKVLNAHKAWLNNKPGGELANLSGADLSRADLSGADLSGADLSGADLSRADLSRADLSGADLSRADLSGADLRSADLSRADLSGAALMSANLSRADLSGANLRSANLSGANLSGADLSESNGVKYCAVTFAGLGQVGRQWLAVEIDGDIRFFCGCFQGTKEELLSNINQGQAELRPSRLRALEILKELIQIEPYKS